MQYDEVQLLELEAAGWIAHFVQTTHMFHRRQVCLRTHTECYADGRTDTIHVMLGFNS